MLTVQMKRDLKDNVWLNVEPSIEGYSKLIQLLLDTLTDEQLAKFANDFAPTEGQED